MNHIEIQNLLRSDLRENRMAKMKEAIVGEIRKMRDLKISRESLSFNFSYPAISMPEMPVIKVWLNCDEPDNGFARGALAKNISVSFRAVVGEWRYVKEVKVKVEFCNDAGYYVN